MKLALVLTAAVAVATTTLVAAPVGATPQPAAEVAPRALVSKSFTVFGKFTSRKIVDYGNANGIGNLTITQGVLDDGAGSKIGTLTTVIRVVAPSTKKDAELRDTQSEIKLKDGQIFAQAVNEDPKAGPPKSLHIMSVTGGTGAYASARGTLIIYPMGSKYRMAYDIFVEKNLKSESFSFDTIVEAGATGEGPQGIGDVALMNAAGGDDSYILVATSAGTAGKTVIDAVDMQLFTPDGTLFARAIARSKSGTATTTTFAVLGGTGSYSGHRGELKLSPNGKSITVKLAAPGGKSKRLAWFEDAGKASADVGITGGTFVGAEGYMYKTAKVNKKKDRIGQYFASLITYDEINGVVPVVGMIEQEFSTSTVIVTGITLGTGSDGAPVARPVVGGTGDAGGAAGQATSVQESSGVWRKAARFWR
ncbi:MAG: hypothetical protein ACO3HV_05335 [Candidatus Nanopelagicales bacterium]